MKTITPKTLLEDLLELIAGARQVNSALLLL
jgi:hypothetical protein